MKRMSLTFGTAFCLIAVVLSSPAFGGVRAITPDMYGGKTNGWQYARHEMIAKAARKSEAKVVFIGDSITHNWESNGAEVWKRRFAEGELRAVNLGISADRTEHVLWRIGEGHALDGYEAKAIVLMIGTNNTGHFNRSKEPVGDTVLGIRAILDTIRVKQPQAKIVLCAIFPRGVDFTDERRIRNDLVNREIMKFADGKDIFWCDFREQFLTPEGILPREVFPDGLHPAEYGYEIWASAVIPYLRAAVRGEPMPPNRYAACCRSQLFRVNGPVASYPQSRIPDPGCNPPDWWLNRYREHREQILASKGEIDLVFAGDSITHYLESNGKSLLAELRKTYSILNLGYGGDRTENLLWRCENGELDGYKAKCITLMIGTNNTGARRDKPKNAAEGIRKILDTMRAKQPQAKIVLMAILPRGASAEDGERKNNDKINEIIKGFADGKDIFWVDFGSEFLDEKGDMVKNAADRLHPTAEAYRKICLPRLLPYFQKFAGK